MLGVWFGFSEGGYGDSGIVESGEGERREFGTRGSPPPPATPPPFCGNLASSRRHLRRRGRGIARFRLLPAVTLLGGGDARSARRHWAGLAEGGAGSARTSRPFLTAADGRGPEEPGRV